MKCLITPIIAVLIAMTVSIASAQHTVTYQGRLSDDGNPVDGNYEMFFIIYDAPTGGVQLDFVNLLDVAVIDGYFTVDLDFSSPQLFVSQDRWMEIRVRPNGGVQTILDPRQPIRAVPRSMRADYGIHSVSVNAPVVKSFDPSFPNDITISLEYAFTQRIDTLETLVADQAALIGTLQTQLSVLQTEIDGFNTDLAELQGRVAIVEDVTDPMTLATIDGYPSIIVEGVNLHLRNGLGNTNTENGLGNLIVGYNESRSLPADNIRTGSHIIVTGREQNYEGSSGFLSGLKNNFNADYGSILGGMSNNNHGFASVVVGGNYNDAGNSYDPNDSFYTVVVGGYNNTARGLAAVILAGQANSTTGDYSAIVAGNGNETIGHRSAIVSGFSHQANGSNSAILGGGFNTTGEFGNSGSGNSAVVAGGYRNQATGTFSVGVGGYVNKSSNTYTVTTSGLFHEATTVGQWISSSYSDTDPGFP